MDPGTERVYPCDLGVTWDDGAPRPIVFACEATTFLAFYLPDHVDWSKPLADEAVLVEEIAIVEFRGCSAISFGHPNEEALSGHRLWRSGLRSGGAYEVESSRWILELERINRVHPRHDPAKWLRKRHFVCTFRDTTFECVADDFAVRIRKESMEVILQELARRLE